MFVCVCVCADLTPGIRPDRGVGGNEAAAGCVGVRDHHDLHPVATGDQRGGPGGAAEAPEPLTADEAVVDVHVVVSAQGVVLQVEGS